MARLERPNVEKHYPYPGDSQKMRARARRYEMFHASYAAKLHSVADKMEKQEQRTKDDKQGEESR